MHHGQGRLGNARGCGDVAHLVDVVDVGVGQCLVANHRLFFQGRQLQHVVVVADAVAVAVQHELIPRAGYRTERQLQALKLNAGVELQTVEVALGDNGCGGGCRVRAGDGVGQRFVWV